MATRVISSEINATSADATWTKISDGLSESPNLLFIFCSPKQGLDSLVAGAKKRFPECAIMGSTTSGEFTETTDTKESGAVLAISGDFHVHSGFGVGLKQDAVRAVEEALKDLPAEVTGYPHRTAILLLDPLAGTGEEAALTAAALLGADVKLAGGAAGDDLAMSKTTVSANGSVGDNAIAVGMIFSKTPLGVGVCHGHQPLSETVKVTRAEGNVVFEVDNKPAWDVWKRLTQASAASRGVDVDALKPEEIPGYLLQYEAGLSLGDGYKIRAPLSLNADGSLAFATGIPDGAMIRITESTAQRQIDSARAAAKMARAQVSGGDVAGAVVFDCICRNLILKDQFKIAIGGIADELGNASLAGFETYGEIALNAGDMSGFHNTTTVVLAFPA